MISLSVIIPTIGRPTLPATLKSLKGLGEQDQIIIVTDGLKPSALAGVLDSDLPPGCPVVFAFMRPEENNFGNGPRQLGMRIATRDYLLFMDDDDIYTEGAFDRIREICQRHKGCTVYFGMKRQDGSVIPGPSALIEGNVSSQCGAVPNDPKRLGKWGQRYSGDFDFYQSSRFPVVWRQDVVICHYRPHEWASP